MFGALGALSGSKNPLINPIAALDRKKDTTPDYGGTRSPGIVTRAGPLSPTSRYGRGAQSLSI
jgi:hypothetical protein